MVSLNECPSLDDIVLRRRVACERWKRNNREYYLEQKRRLSSRPDYRAHRRQMYKDRTDELKLLGILPRKRGRPTMFVGPEALDRKRERAREAATRYRARQKLSPVQEKDESTESSARSSEESDSFSDSGRKSTQGA